MRTLALSLASLFLFTAISTAAEPERWNQFRGPHGDGSTTAAGLPLTWSETQNVRWKTPIHDKGWSSPVLWEDKIWLTTAREDGKEMFVVCVDLKSGEKLIDKKIYDIEKPAFCHAMNSYASPTCVAEQDRVYVHFGSYGTLCLDAKDASTVWERRDLPCDHFRGPGSSPIVHGDLLYLTYDGFDYQYVAALDKRTGKTIWKKDRSIEYGTDNGDLKKAYGTPSVFEIDGRQLLVSPAAVGTVAHDALTGEEIWKVQHGGMNVAARPLLGNGLLYLSTGYGGFKFYALRPDGKGNVTDSHVVWKFNKTPPTRPSQLLQGDLLYLINDAGVATCLDAKTGEQVWSERVGGNFSASPILAGDRIYLFSEDGATSVIKTGRKFELLATNKLNDGCMASPAVAGNSLLIRTKTNLYRIEEGATASK